MKIIKLRIPKIKPCQIASVVGYLIGFLIVMGSIENLRFVHYFGIALVYFSGSLLHTSD